MFSTSCFLFPAVFLNDASPPPFTRQIAQPMPASRVHSPNQTLTRDENQYRAGERHSWYQRSNMFDLFFSLKREHCVMFFQPLPRNRTHVLFHFQPATVQRATEDACEPSWKHLEVYSSWTRANCCESFYQIIYTHIYKKIILFRVRNVLTIWKEQKSFSKIIKAHFYHRFYFMQYIKAIWFKDQQNLQNRPSGMNSGKRYWCFTVNQPFRILQLWP